MGRALALLDRVDRLAAHHLKRYGQAAPASITYKIPALLPHPVAWAEDVLGVHLDPWQQELVTSTAISMIAACARQVGKTEAIIVAVAYQLMHFPGLVVILANGDRTAGEIFARVRDALSRAGASISSSDDNKRSCSLREPRSRLLALPAAPKTVRGIAGVRLLILDEAAFMPPELFAAVEPMVAAAGGRTIYASSPNGQLGRFWDLWSMSGIPRVQVTAYDCPRISHEFLEQQRQTMTRRAFAAEYLASFEDAEGALFDGENISAAMVPVDTEALFV